MSPIAPILAFGFANLAMLGWLAAAAVPLLIHLWSRRRYRQTSWAAMEYLLAAIRQSRRKLQLEQLLLLAVRTLLVVLVVLAVAGPYFQRGGFVSTPGERTHRLIVIDGSFSMGYVTADKSRFESAKELAARIVQQSPQGDGFTLVVMSSPPQVVVGTPVFEPRDFLREIDGLTLPHTSADLPATLTKIEQILQEARREHPKLTRHEVYFLSDLCRVGWVGEPADTAPGTEFRRRARRLAQSASPVVIDLGQTGCNNLAITGLYAQESFVTLGRKVNVRAVLKNFAPTALKRQTVELLVDGRRVDQQDVDLAPAGEASAGFSYRFQTPGDHVLEVRAEGDRDHLQIDNHRWLAVDVKQSVNVLCVDGRPSGEPFAGATGYLACALAPRDDPASRAPVRPEVVPESALLELNLGRYDCIFLCDVAQFTAGEARVLDAYVKSGGSLVFFLGEQVLGDRYNRELTGDSPGKPRLLPARLGSLVEAPSYRLDPLGYRHPIVRAFRTSQRAGLLTTPVEKHFKLKLPARSKAKVVLAIDNGDPLIVEEPIGRGRVVLVATSADVSWTPMPLWPSYLPIVQEVLNYAIGGRLRQKTILVGDQLGATVPTPAGDVSLSLQTPNDRVEDLRLRTEGDYGTWTFGETTTSGVYTAEFGPPISRTERYAVNVDTVESDLTRLTPEELRGLWIVDCGFRIVSDGVRLPPHVATSFQIHNPQSTIHNSLTKTLLYGVLALLLMETFLAWRFGHHTT